MASAQTYFYHNPKLQYSVTVVYFVSSNKIVFATATKDQVKQGLMANINAYEDALRQYASHGSTYDGDFAKSTSLGDFYCCDFYQTMSGYNLYGYRIRTVYGDFNKVVDFGISTDKQTFVSSVTNDILRRYFNRVDKSFFLPSL